MKLFNTIRKKIWFCVNVAFVGFIIATGFTLYSNHQQKLHLSHVRDLDFNLAMRSNDLLNLFVVQNNYYKESFLFGSSESAQKGNELCEQVTAEIRAMTNIKRSFFDLPQDRAESLRSLEQNYKKYVEQARELYPLLAEGHDPREYLESLQHLAASQSEIHNRLKYFAQFYSRQFSRNVTSLMDTAEKNSVYLAVFFLVLLVVMTLLVNWAAERTLINPLAHIKKAVQGFGKGERNFPALERMDESDDIGALGKAIITMTEDLVKTTVLKAHVDSILQNMNDSLIVTSETLHIRSVNKATLDMLGYCEEELVGQSIGKVLQDFTRDDAKEQETRDGGRLLSYLCSNAERTFLTVDGTQIPVLLSTSILQDNNTASQGLVYVAKDITERKKAEEKLEQMAMYDFLTGLPNRMTFNDRLEQTLKKARRRGNQTGLMFIDLDRFKKINDTIGHHCGDSLLKKVADWLLHCVRDSDTVARIGGDEFAVILDNLLEPQDVVNTSERILEAFKQPVICGGEEVFSTPSIGIAIYPLDAKDTEELLKNADLAMYQAKKTGGNRYVFFSRKEGTDRP